MKLSIEDIAKAKSNPLFDGLADELKDVEKFKEVEKTLAKTMLSDHKHNQVKAFVKCERCKTKLNKRRDVLKRYGFTDYYQYLGYKRIMDIISNKKDIVL